MIKHEHDNFMTYEKRGYFWKLHGWMRCFANVKWLAVFFVSLFFIPDVILKKNPPLA